MTIITEKIIPTYRLVPFTSNGINRHVPIPITIDQENRIIYRGDPAGRSIFVHDLDDKVLYCIKIHDISLNKFALCLIRENILVLTNVIWKSNLFHQFTKVEYNLFTTQGDFITKVQFESPPISTTAFDNCMYSPVTDTLYICTMGSLYASSDYGVTKIQLNYREDELSNTNGVALINDSNEVVCSTIEGIYSVNPHNTVFRSYLKMRNMSRIVMLDNHHFCGIEYNKMVLGSLKSNKICVSRQQITYYTKHDIAIHRKSGRVYITQINNSMQIFKIDKLIKIYKSCS